MPMRKWLWAKAPLGAVKANAKASKRTVCFMATPVLSTGIARAMPSDFLRSRGVDPVEVFVGVRGLGRTERGAYITSLPSAETALGREVLERLVRLRPMPVVQLEPRPRGLPRLAHPDLAVGMQPAAARRRHGGGAGAVEQAGVRRATVGMNAAVGGNDLLPGRLAPGEDSCVGEWRAVEL